MNYKEAKRLHDIYLCGASLSKLALNHTTKYSRQQIYYYFKMFNLPTRAKNSEYNFYILFNNRKYTFKKGYWLRTIPPRTTLQRDYYEYHNGKIPKDYNVV